MRPVVCCQTASGAGADSVMKGRALLGPGNRLATTVFCWLKEAVLLVAPAAQGKSIPGSGLTVRRVDERMWSR